MDQPLLQRRKFPASSWACSEKFGYLLFLCILFFSLTSFSGQAQVIVYEDFVPPKQKFYTRERFFSFYLQTSGFTIGYEQGKLNKKFRYHGWAIEFATQLIPKAIRISWTGSGRRYVYGQINSFCVLRAGYGGHYTFNEKPFSGGVSLSLIYQGGLSLGLAFPQYLYVSYPLPGASTSETKLEKMDPDNPAHYQVERILGRGPIMYGVWHLRPYPGIYAKLGLHTEFGKKEKISHALEVGITYDCFFTRIPLMAQNKNPFGFLNLYAAYRFGMRYGLK